MIEHSCGQVQLRKRGKFWHVRYHTPAGRIAKSLKLTNLRLAEQEAWKINEALERGEYTALARLDQRKQTLFREFVPEFLASYERWSARTKKANSSILKFLLAEFGELPLSAITAESIQGYLSRRRDQDKIADATYNRTLATLKSILRTAKEWDYVKFDAAAGVKMIPEQQQPPAALTEEELERFLAELPTEARSIALIAADTGLRTSELRALTWADIDLEARSILVAQSKNRDYRVVPTTDRVHALLCQLWSELSREKVASLRVLPGIELAKLFHQAGIAAGIGHVHPHQLRHTFATRLRDRGVPLDRIMELLGHRSMQMVLRYAKARPEQLRTAIEALNLRSGS